MTSQLRNSCMWTANLLFLIAVSTTAGYAQTISHQVTLPAGGGWCDDSSIISLFNNINSFRAQNGVPALKMDAVGMKVADARAVQFSQYMMTHNPSTPGFNPHEGYDTTAASFGYYLMSENLAWSTSDPYYVVYALWQDGFHRAALLSSGSNVAGVSCINYNGTPFWTYEPGYAQNVQTPAPTPSPTPTPTPTPTPAPTPTDNSAVSLDSEQSAFLSLINAFRAQNGVGPLQISPTLQASSQWMSNDLATNNYFSHTDSQGRGTAARLAAFGYSYSPWGENIAAGYSDAQSTLNQWANACDSDGSGQCTYAHRKNMLSASFTAIGIGRVFNASSSYGWYWTTDFGGYVDSGSGSVPTPTPTPTPVPSISSFTASPSAITAGQTVTLSWNVSGATSVTIDNGLGGVPGVASVTVSPRQATTYRLTATNASGTSTAAVTITVNAPAGDLQAPSAAVITSASVKSSVAMNPQTNAVTNSASVDITWAASTDNVGVAGYQVFRNGAMIATLPANTLTYSDTGTMPNSTYNYVVNTYDAAGNSSTGKNTVQVITPTPPASF